MWRQGEHVCIVGDTGSGKSYLETQLLLYRAAVIVLRTKSDPDIKFKDFKTIRRIKDIDIHGWHYVLDPTYENQALECARALDLVWREGGWCIAIDELYYAIHDLNLERYINRLITQGRSPHISVVCGMQRPTGVTRFALSQATHCFFFAQEGRDIKTIAEATTPRLIPEFARLRPHEFVYYNRSTREIQRGYAQQLERILR